MSTTATTEPGRQLIHVLRYPEQRVEFHIGDETLVYRMPEFYLETEEVVRGCGVHGQPIALGIVELPANAYVSRSSVDFPRPAGFGASVPGGVDFRQGYRDYFQVGAGSVLDLATDPYFSELLGLKLVADHRVAC